jgi:hypothetical protein
MIIRTPIAGKKLILLILAGAVVIAAPVFAWLIYPRIEDAGSSNGFECSRGHIYIPRRLDFKGCKTVTGVMTHFKIETDGDTHGRLKLDPRYEYLLTKQNYARQQGQLVIEDICHVKPRFSLTAAAAACKGYRSPLPDPIIGQRYEITGNYVIDDWHGSWAEIHGIAEMKRIE